MTPALFGIGNWTGILSVLLIILSFYFTLSFFQHLREGDDRLIRQSKLAAVSCLALALLIPVIVNFVLFRQLMG